LLSDYFFSEEINTEGWDLLLPYSDDDSYRSNRYRRDSQACKNIRYGNTTYSLHDAHSNTSDMSSVVETHHRVFMAGEYYFEQHAVTLR
jgi:hypothetical protein